MMAMSAGRTRLWAAVLVVVMCIFLGAGAGVLAVKHAKAPYVSHSTLMVSPKSAAAAGDFLDRVPTFAQFGQSDAVLDPAAKSLGMGGADDLRSLVEVSSPQKTVLINVQASVSDSRRAQDVANTVAAQLRRSLLAAYGKDVAPDESILVSVADPARPGTRSETVGSGLGALVGGLIGAGVAVALLELLRAVRRRGA